MSKSRARGTAWESAIVDYLRANGAPHAERRALGGAKDRGDVAGVVGLVVEAKSAARLEFGVWLTEAETERANDRADLGVVWAKRRGKASPADAYVVMTGAALVHLLAAAGYIEPKGMPMEPTEREREDFARTVVCPTCEAQPGKRCRYKGGGLLASGDFSHLGRLKVARGERL